MPHVAGRAEAELDSLRVACDQAAQALLDVDEIVVVGSGPQWRAYPAGSSGDLAGYGVRSDPVALAGAPPDPRPTLPLSLTVGAWLLTRAGVRTPARGVGVPEDTDGPAAVKLGADLVDTDSAVGLLVMGDGSARRVEDSPGYVHPEGLPFDAAVERLLTTADRDGVAALDPQLARDVLAVGRVPWQVAAGAAPATARGTLLYADAPHDVGYFVAVWTAR
jgi:hypothetical protein